MLPTAMPTIAAGTLLLRAFEPDDAALVQAVAHDPLIPLITTVPRSGSRTDALAFIERQHSRQVEGSGYSFAIADAMTNQALGQIGLWTREIAKGRASTGYWIAPAFRRRGYVRAALQALSDWALEIDEVQRLQLFVEPWNEGSWRAAEACGFQREGLLRRWELIGDDYRDLFAYSRIRPS